MKLNYFWLRLIAEEDVEVYCCDEECGNIFRCLE
jgi:hypothetical protein